MRACIYIALDGLTKQQALSLVRKLSKSPYAGVIAGFKIHDLWDVCGPGIVRELKGAGAKEVWADLKLNDTPKTVGLRAAAVAKAGADLISVHASAGIRALRGATAQNLRVAAITALTSLDSKEVKEIFGAAPKTAVTKLARIAKKAGVWGVVCSTEEVRELPKLGLHCIVPGIQFGAKRGSNQKRIGTPAQALKNGASYLVIGTAITGSKKSR